MKHLSRLPILAFLLVGLAACGSTPVLEESLDTSPGATKLVGTIVNIVEVQEEAGLGAKLGGALIGGAIGSQIGGGTGNSIAVGVGAVGGAAVADHALGDTVHRVTLKETKTGLTFDVIVHSNGFLMNDDVVFTVVSGKVTSIMHKALADARDA